MDAATKAAEASKANQANYPIMGVDKGEARAAKLNTYRMEALRIEEEFAQDVMEEEGIFSLEVNRVIFDRAWADGHSGGYNEVQGMFSGYTDFAQALFTAA